ncbi:MAG: sortase [Clostridiales bacterium]|nr:sortase [Clostridiales bacterium]
MRIGMSIHHPVVTGIKIVILLAMLAVILYQPVISLIRQRYIDGYIEQFEYSLACGGNSSSDNFIVPDSPVFAIEGEYGQSGEGEYYEDPSSVGSGYDDKRKGLKLLGVLKIPSIDTEVPVWEGVSVKALRFGVGRYPLSSDLGSDSGNCFIMGHRNRHLSTIFCRLQYVNVGDQVEVTTRDGGTVEYKVAKTAAVPPDKVEEYITGSGDGQPKLTLCTCLTERGRGWRFIAVCTKSEF